eukprot:jgi/Bigna1/46738/estExt_Genewise1.C_60276
MSTNRQVVVLDNGGYTCKAGIGGQDQPLRVLPNCAVKPKRERRFFLADQIDDILDLSQVIYKRPCERGYTTNWDIQCEIWDRVYKHVLKINPSESDLLVSEPVCNLRSLSRSMDEIVFEKYQFQNYARLPAPSMALYYANSALANKGGAGMLSETYSVVVDVGYSFSHVVPFMEEAPINHAIKRVSVGGKLLTNYLKEVISYRAFSMMDETHLINHVKEKVCFTSTDFQVDLVKAKLSKKKNPYRLEYVLPTHVDGKTLGYIKTEDSKTTDDDQILTLSNERITVPELLFSPSMIGIKQGGIAEAITQSVKACHPDIQALLYKNIVLIGGSTKFPNFQKRLRQDLRAQVPSDWEINIRSAGSGVDPSLCAWKGGSMMVKSGAYSNYSLSKKTYEEYGPDACKRKFYWYA